MRPLSDIMNDGFKLPDATRSLDGLPLVSLRIGLRAYFESYKAMSHLLHAFEGKTTVDDLKLVDYLHSTPYLAAYTQSIFHCHHFVELAMKDILRDLHPGHAVLFGKRKDLEQRFKQNQPLTDAEQSELKSVEFSTALERLCELLKNGQIDPQCDFIRQQEPFLSQLNILRNRLLHRGIFILRYQALDEMFGKWLLPIIKQITSSKRYASHATFWKWNPLKCSVDPIDELIKVWSTASYDMQRVGLIKELGRAGYEGYPRNSDILEGIAGNMAVDHIKNAKALAEKMRSSVRECPVCGFETLVCHEDWDVDVSTGLSGPAHPYMHRCSWCTFEIDYHVKNPSEYGLPITDFW